MTSAEKEIHWCTDRVCVDVAGQPEKTHLRPGKRQNMSVLTVLSL